MPFIAAVFADDVTGELSPATGYRRGAVAKYMLVHCQMAQPMAQWPQIMEYQAHLAVLVRMS